MLCTKTMLIALLITEDRMRLIRLWSRRKIIVIFWSSWGKLMYPEQNHHTNVASINHFVTPHSCFSSLVWSGLQWTAWVCVMMQKKSETRVTAGVVKADPSTQMVKKSVHFGGTALQVFMVRLHFRRRKQRVKREWNCPVCTWWAFLLSFCLFFSSVLLSDHPDTTAPVDWA